jgi:hypothetical protein
MLLSAAGGLNMRGIGRLIAASALAGAVVGVAAFAHLLGSVPAASVSIAELPPAPAGPLVVDAAPWSPATPAGAGRLTVGQAIQTGRRAFLQIPATRLATPVKRPSAPARASHSATAGLAAKQSRAATPAPAAPAATPATTPPAAEPQPAPAATPATTPVAAPAAAPTVTTLSAATAVPATPTPAHTTRSHGGPPTADGRSHRTIRRFERSEADSGGPTLLTVAPVQTATPAPVVGYQPPSVEPPPTGATTAAAPVAPTTAAPVATPTVTSPTVSSATGYYHFDGQDSHVGWQGDANDGQSH